MDPVKSYFNKPWDPNAMEGTGPIPDYVHDHLCMVYWTLFNTTAFSMFGAYWHLMYDGGGCLSALNVASIVCCLFYMPPWWEIPRLIFLLIAAFLFGASVGPLINLIIVVDQSDIAKVFAGASLFFCCYSASVISNSKRQFIYRVGEFSASILIPAWVITYFLGIPILWVTAVFSHRLITDNVETWCDVPIQVAWIWFLSHHYNLNLWDLLLIYLTLSPFIFRMKTHSQESIYMASRGESYYVSHTISFLTSFPDLTAYRHLVGFMISNMRGMLKSICIQAPKFRTYFI